jgi:hypothetical protein
MKKDEVNPFVTSITTQIIFKNNNTKKYILIKWFAFEPKKGRKDFYF